MDAARLRRSGSAARGVAWALLAGLAVGGCQSWPVAKCNEWIDAFATRMVECGFYASHEEAEAALIEGLSSGRLDGCDDVDGIVIPELWEEQCIPQTRALDCDATELPNACRGQLIDRE